MAANNEDTLQSTENEADQERRKSAHSSTQNLNLTEMDDSEIKTITNSLSNHFLLGPTSINTSKIGLSDIFKEYIKNPLLTNPTTNSETPKKTKLNPKQKKSKQIKFPAYFSKQEAEDGLKRGELIKGIIRINPKDNRKAYISNEDPTQEDYVLPSADDRNRALEGDVVVIKLKPQSEWTKNKKTSFVVYILERIHSRTTVGTLRKFSDNNKQFIMFISRDYRIPKIRVSTSDCPSFYEHPQKYRNILFKVKITAWTDARYAVGTIIEKIGIVGDLEAETTALLIETDLDLTPFPDDVVQGLPVTASSEFGNRLDLRKECIFTIDPLTAHDLDDAVSCKELSNGNLEIGVHISDVTHYLKEDTPLDKLACKKGTTVYLVNKAFHMLPQELRLECSLKPGSDKLAISVIWEMGKNGEIIRQYFARTVINSCAQLAYEHAQAMIDNPYRVGDLPEIFGDFTYKDLRKAISYLHEIAQSLRAQRFEAGALKIDQTKLMFQLDKDTGEPFEYKEYENKEANELIEEFMLLANRTVAHKIAEDFPDLAFLRCHDPPNERLLLHWKRTFELFGIDLVVSSSKALESSIRKIQANRNFGKAQMAVLRHLIVRPMKRARYFCSANTKNKNDFFHYALHVPVYTHFTSPIRRYADIVVHRLLSASLGYAKKHLWKVKYLTTVANNCNKKKYSAKCAQDYSSDLYLAHYVEKHQPFIQDAVVVDVKKYSFDVFIIATGSVIRMNVKAFGEDVQYIKEQNNLLKRFLLILPKTSEYPEQKYVIQLFTILKVSLFRSNFMRRLGANPMRGVTNV